MLKYFLLFRAVMRKEELESYTHLANITADNKEIKTSHLSEVDLSYFRHMLVSLRCAWYLLPVLLFCLVHAFIPNIKPTYATDKLKDFSRFYEVIKYKFRPTKPLPGLFDYDL